MFHCISLYLQQINFFKSNCDLIFDLFGLSLFYENFETNFLVLTYATVNLNSFRNMFALFRHGFNLVLPST